MKPGKAKSIDEYIARYPPATQKILNKFRRVIRESAPQAEEVISYKIPTFKLNGNLVHFGAFKDHISFFPTSSARRAFKRELSKYKGGRGTVQFPLDERIPFGLIRKIVIFRVRENLGTAEK